MRMELKEWNLEYKQALINICTQVDRSYLSDRLPEPYTEEAADSWLNMVKEHDRKEGIFRAVVYEGKIVGNISIERKSGIYRKDAELGYMLLTEYWSKGIATEAVGLICKEAFEELDIIRLTAFAYQKNIASQKVLERNGFVYEGMQRKAIYKNEQFYDLNFYGKLK